jgi:tRNA A-37 threonylcarbamoyl transferase component Bud32
VELGLRYFSNGRAFAELTGGNLLEGDMTLVLKDTGLLAALSRTVDRAAEGIKLNEIKRRRRGGRVGVMKRRNAVSWAITGLANFYFGMAGLPIRFLSGRKWQRWEAGCFRLMNEGFEASAVGEDRVWADHVPGENLFDVMRAERLRREMVEAAGRELRRCHERFSEELDGAWSHGDATMSNVIYDQRTGRARLIDFEIVHVKRLGAAERHADDLLVFLLDLVGFVPEERWIPLATAFLRAYGEGAALGALAERLEPWRGLARIWWKVRTNHAEGGMVGRRLAALKGELRS